MIQCRALHIFYAQKIDIYIYTSHFGLRVAGTSKLRNYKVGQTHGVISRGPITPQEFVRGEVRDPSISHPKNGKLGKSAFGRGGDMLGNPGGYNHNSIENDRLGVAHNFM